MNCAKKIILVLTAQAVILGFGLGNALWHPSAVTIGSAAFMAALLPLSLRNVFRVAAA